MTTKEALNNNLLLEYSAQSSRNSKTVDVLLNTIPTYRITNILIRQNHPKSITVGIFKAGYVFQADLDYDGRISVLISTLRNEFLISYPNLPQDELEDKLSGFDLLFN